MFRLPKKHLFILITLSISFTLSGCGYFKETLFQSEQQSETAHVVLISIDGLRPNIYQNKDNLGISLPVMSALQNNGISAAGMRGIFPTLTYPSHTTLVTGTRPSEHGIPTNHNTDGQSRKFASAITSKTLWQAASDKGLTTASIAWPVTVGAKIDFLIPEDPSSGEATLDGALRTGATKGLFDALEQNLGPITLPPYSAPNAVKKMDAVIARIAAEIIRTESPHLLLVHFLEADSRQHKDGINSAAALHAFENIDAHIGQLHQAVKEAGLEEKTTFIIVGDHGFMNTPKSISLPALLREAHPNIALPSLALHATGGSAAVYLEAQEVSPEQATTLALKTKAHVEEHYGDAITFLSQEALEERRTFPDALFALSSKKDFLFTKAPSEKVVSPSKEKVATHGHLPEMDEMLAGFIASGPALRKNHMIDELHITDVAPLAAHLLAIDLGLPLKESIRRNLFVDAPLP